MKIIRVHCLTAFEKTVVRMLGCLIADLLHIVLTFKIQNGK